MNSKHYLTKYLTYIRRKPIDVFIILLFLFAIVKLSSLYLSVKPGDGNWEQYKQEHGCKLRVTEGGTQQSSWECADGEIYYRWMQQR